jgi:phenylacetic acid degradation operon negative regulatory protein
LTIIPRPKPSSRAERSDPAAARDEPVGSLRSARDDGRVASSPFLDALHADKPLRVWSLIVTIFGDVVMRRGVEVAPGPIWISPLLALLERLRVDAGLARTSLSRLVAGGVLEREKAGRNTFYRLTRSSAEEFARAADTIYGRRRIAPADSFRLALIDRCSDRSRARAALEGSGFRFFNPTTALAPWNEATPAPEGVVEARARADGAIVDLARELWKVEELQAAYRDFVARFGGFGAATWSPGDAIVARVVAVHRMRRIVLRDPGLPTAALPTDWAGDAARELFARLLEAVAEASEAWLEEQRFRDGRA